MRCSGLPSTQFIAVQDLSSTQASEVLGFIQHPIYCGAGQKKQITACMTTSQQMAIVYMTTSQQAVIVYMTTSQQAVIVYMTTR
ncbi:MAG: hypothetical protein CSA21_08340 [Deltaproteobacteria bacterium]|nr:MAG: hypothetical protein CSA21_08340 [Deltaproteobacteria bacterium]